MRLFKTILNIGFVFSVIYFGFLIVEPQIIDAVNDEVLINQNVATGIAINYPSVNMLGLSQNRSADVASSTWSIKTNNPAGWIATISAESNESCDDRAGDGQNDVLCNLMSENTPKEAFMDLATTTRDSWDNMTAGSNYFFGFSVAGVLADENTNITGWGEGYCGTASTTPSNNLKWQGFWAGNQIEIASSTTLTDQDGSDIVICFGSEQDGVAAPNGNYYATTTVTVVGQ